MFGNPLFYIPSMMAVVAGWLCKDVAGFFWITYFCDTKNASAVCKFTQPKFLNLSVPYGSGVLTLSGHPEKDERQQG